MAAVPHLKDAVNSCLAAVKEFEHHQAFKTRFLKNLLSTPWCSMDHWQWENILKEKEPFSKNLTLQNYVPNNWDDNEFYKA